MSTKLKIGKNITKETMIREEQVVLAKYFDKC